MVSTLVKKSTYDFIELAQLPACNKKCLTCHNNELWPAYYTAMLAQRYFYQKCVCIFNILKSDDSPLNILIGMQRQNNYNLRSVNNELSLNIPFPRTELFKQSFSYSSAVSWNSLALPSNIRSILSLHIFKRSCKGYILSNFVD